MVLAFTPKKLPVTPQQHSTVPMVRRSRGQTLHNQKHNLICHNRANKSRQPQGTGLKFPEERAHCKNPHSGQTL